MMSECCNDVIVAAVAAIIIIINRFVYCRKIVTSEALDTSEALVVVAEYSANRGVRVAEGASVNRVPKVRIVAEV